MSLFDRLVDQALKNQDELAPLRIVVEKELLHHDILREMSTAGLLKDLTFIGGTCLRACYGSSRLSENLDFTGGSKFQRKTLMNLSRVLVKNLQEKYSLQVEVNEPTRETGNVDTWKLKVITRPRQQSLPTQRIHSYRYLCHSQLRQTTHVAAQPLWCGDGNFGAHNPSTKPGRNSCRQDGGPGLET